MTVSIPIFWHGCAAHWPAAKSARHFQSKLCDDTSEPSLGLRHETAPSGLLLVCRPVVLGCRRPAADDAEADAAAGNENRPATGGRAAATAAGDNTLHAGDAFGPGDDTGAVGLFAGAAAARRPGS